MPTSRIFMTPGGVFPPIPTPSLPPQQERYYTGRWLEGEAQNFATLVEQRITKNPAWVEAEIFTRYFLAGMEWNTKVSKGSIH